jgi:hypothetical protein
VLDLSARREEGEVPQTCAGVDDHAGHGHDADADGHVVADDDGGVDGVHEGQPGDARDELVADELARPVVPDGDQRGLGAALRDDLARPLLPADDLVAVELAAQRMHRVDDADDAVPAFAPDDVDGVAELVAASDQHDLHRALTPLGPRRIRPRR